MKTIHIIIGLLLVSKCLFSQNLKVIEVDTVSNVPKQTLPFDEPFILKMKKVKEPRFIVITSHIRNKTFVQSLDFYIEKEIKRRPKINSYKSRIDSKKEVLEKRNNKIDIKTNDKIAKLEIKLNKKQQNAPLTKEFKRIPKSQFWTTGKYLYIKFDYYPYSIDRYEIQNNILMPSKDYTILVISNDDVSYEIFRKLYLFEQSNKKDSTFFKSALKLYEKNYHEQENILGKNTSFLAPTTKFETFYKTQYSSIKGDFLKLDTIKRRISILDTNAISFYEHSYLNSIIQFINITDSTKLKTTSVDRQEIFETCHKLFFLKDSNLIKLTDGKLNFSSLELVEKENDFSTRKNNCLSTLKDVVILENSIKKMSFIGLAQDDGFQQMLGSFKDSINSNLKVIENIITQEEATKNKAFNNDFYNISNYNSSTVVLDFEKRAKFQITPDFGWVAYGLQKDFTGFTPYLGFHINFRYVNKNIPFNKIPNKTPLHYLSFMTAWSLTSLSEEGKRVDFFSNSSLFTGLGIRINNYLRLTCGTTWFYKVDPNPLITDKTIAVAPYLGLSVDLDIKQFLNGFMDLKPNK